MYKMSVSVDDTNCNGIKSEVLSLELHNKQIRFSGGRGLGP